MTADLKPPARAAALGAPPPASEAPGNIGKPVTQLNARLEPEVHQEIKIAAIREGMSLGEYIVASHECFQNVKQEGKKGA